VTTDSGEALSTTIAAFELSDDGTRVAASAEVVESTRKQGAFELELSVQPHVLLAFARDWRPATVRIACSEGETLELSPIVLDRGFSISGQALLGSAPFAAGMIVIADLDRPVSTVNAGTSSFVWTGERFEWPRRQARANELGLFEITALGDRVYSVRLLGVGDPGTPMLLDAQSVSVLAPASDVEISPGLCELHVAVYKSGVPAEQRLAIREAIGRFSERFSEFATDKSGHATMWVSPNYPAELIVDRATRNERVFSLPSCTANGSAELRIDL
jgi:hypothetical protein